jgi:hypothetical protein
VVCSTAKAEPEPLARARARARSQKGECEPVRGSIMCASAVALLNSSHKFGFFSPHKMLSQIRYTLGFTPWESESRESEERLIPPYLPYPPPPPRRCTRCTWRSTATTRAEQS